MCITLDVMPADVTVEYVLDYISETGRDMHHCQKVSRLTCSVFLHKLWACAFYSASALLAMQSAVLARGILSVCLSVCLSFRHVPVLCPDE